MSRNYNDRILPLIFDDFTLRLHCKRNGWKPISDFFVVAEGWERMFPRVRFLKLDVSIQFCRRELWRKPDIQKETVRILVGLQRTLGTIKNLQKLEFVSTAAGRTWTTPGISDRIYEGLVKMLVSNPPTLEGLHLPPCLFLARGYGRPQMPPKSVDHRDSSGSRGQ